MTYPFPLHVFTIVRDGLPWLACTFAELTRLTDLPWTWTIVHGTAMNVKDTRWVQPQSPRLSNDGTAVLLESFVGHPRIRVLEKARWEGKVEMVNAAVATFKEPGVLLEVDCDELWQANQLRDIVHLFEDDPALMLARFHCRYFLTANCITTDDGNPNEWLRAWRFRPGMTFSTHEPPVLDGNKGKSLNRRETASLGLVFEHHAWTYQDSVARKEAYYGGRHAGVLEGWKKLLTNTEWPLKDAGKFLPAAFKGCPADKIF